MLHWFVCRLHVPATTRLLSVQNINMIWPGGCGNSGCAGSTGTAPGAGPPGRYSQCEQRRSGFDAPAAFRYPRPARFRDLL